MLLQLQIANTVPLLGVRCESGEKGYRPQVHVAAKPWLIVFTDTVLKVFFPSSYIPTSSCSVASLSCPTASQLDSMPNCVNRPPPPPRPCRGHLSRYTVSQGPGGSRQQWLLLAGGGEKTSNGGPVSMAPILRLPTALHRNSCAREAARKPQWAFHPPDTFLGLF